MRIHRNHRTFVAALGLFTATVALPACSGVPGEAGVAVEAIEDQTAAGERDSTVVVSQIKAAQLALASKNMGAKIVGYAAAAPLASDADVAAAKLELSADRAMVPQVNGDDPDTFSVSTIQERMSAAAPAAADSEAAPRVDVRTRIESMVYPLLKAGQKSMTITWAKPDGTQFQSRCVYDANGVVYDNMLSNLVVTETTTAAEAHLPKAKPKTPDSDEDPQAFQATTEATTEAAAVSGTRSFTATPVDVTIKWIWGGKRGKIVINHTILYRGNTIVENFGTATHWMTAGDTGAQTKSTVVDNRNHFAKIAWGYAWATPTADFDISFDARRGEVGGSFKVSLKGVGSKGGGDGHHVNYL